MRGNFLTRLGNYGVQMGIPPAVFLLLLSNLAVFMLQFFLRAATGRIDPLFVWFSFIPTFAINQLQIWRFVTYMFLHGDLMHLFWNMIGLWLFGTRIEMIWGTRTFAWYYFLCGIGGALLHGIIAVSGGTGQGQVVGASGGLLGIVLAFGFAFPRSVIYLFLVVPVPAFLVVIMFILFSVMGVGGPHIAHMAHLGGMITGFILLWLFTGGRPSQVPRFPGRARGGYRTVGGRGRGGQGGGSSFLGQLRQQYVRWRTRLRVRIVSGPPRDREPTGAQKRANGRGGNGQDLQRVDEILEKISQRGLKSLTPEEQEILRRASKKD